MADQVSPAVIKTEELPVQAGDKVNIEKIWRKRNFKTS